MSEFDGVAPALAQALADRGYSDLTPVQAAVLAPELAGADLLVSAQTGSGKTVAFGLALAPGLLDGAERFGPAAAPLALAVAPTRELALQVRRELEWLYAPTGALIASCVGGMDMRSERRALERGAHIVVGTPGRLRDHIERASLDMGSLRAIVLDEADEMLDLGFREDLEFILGRAPAERRTLMFSATVPRAIAALAKDYQRDAVRISTAAEKSQHVDIDYRAYTVSAGDREHAIINILRLVEAQNALVFCGTRAAVNHLTARFNNRGFSVVALSGELSQTERSHALQAMRDGRAQVCIATDVAARGIDLPGLELVIHADLPSNRETLLHRSGRTGRAGRKGVSALIVPHSAGRKAERLLQTAGITATWLRPPSAEEVLARDDERLLAHETLSLPVTPEEQALVDALLARHGPAQVAAALVRQARARKSAPEELMDGAGETGPAARRAEFGESVWFAVSAGRNQNAEPRWLLPMLCRAGDLTRREIGAIRIQEDETFVQILADCAGRFMAAVGPEGVMENSLRIRPLDRAPDLGAAPQAAAAAPSAAARKPRQAERGPRPAAAPHPAPPRASPAPAPRAADAPAAPHPVEAPAAAAARATDAPAAPPPAAAPESAPKARPAPTPGAGDARPRPAKTPGAGDARPRPTQPPGAGYARPRPAQMSGADEGAPRPAPARPEAAPAARPRPANAADPSARIERPGRKSTSRPPAAAPGARPAGKPRTKPGAKPWKRPQKPGEPTRGAPPAAGAGGKSASRPAGKPTFGKPGAGKPYASRPAGDRPGGKPRPGGPTRPRKP